MPSMFTPNHDHAVTTLPKMAQLTRPRSRMMPPQPFERRFREPVAVQPDAQHVHPKPRPRRDDVAEDGAVDEAALADDAAPAQMQDERVPQHDDERAVFL